MKIKTLEISLHTKAVFDTIDITPELQKNLDKTKLHEGQVLIFVSGSTAGLTTIEYEPGLLKDIKDFFERVAPVDIPYGHEEMWHDGNGHSHIRSSILKPFFTVPFSEGRLLLGTWQQVIFIEFDNKPRERKIVTQFTGIS